MDLFKNDWAANRQRFGRLRIGEIMAFGGPLLRRRVCHPAQMLFDIPQMGVTCPGDGLTIGQLLDALRERFTFMYVAPFPNVKNMRRLTRHQPEQTY